MYPWLVDINAKTFLLPFALFRYIFRIPTVVLKSKLVLLFYKHAYATTIKVLEGNMFRLSFRFLGYILNCLVLEIFTKID